jgi:hypothetical protein
VARVLAEDGGLRHPFWAVAFAAVYLQPPHHRVVWRRHAQGPGGQGREDRLRLCAGGRAAS